MLHVYKRIIFDESFRRTGRVGDYFAIDQFDDAIATSGQLHIVCHQQYRGATRRAHVAQ